VESNRVLKRLCSIVSDFGAFNEREREREREGERERERERIKDRERECTGTPRD